MSNTRQIKDKYGQPHTLVAKTRKVGLGWEGYVHDETSNITAATVTQRQRTEAAALKLARAAMNDFADNIERKQRTNRE